MALGRKAAMVLVVISAAALGITACSATTTGPGGANSPTPSSAPQAAIAVLNILPPGNTEGPSQRAMYDALNTIDPKTLTDSQLTTYYKSAPLDPPAGTVVKTENPKSGVTIKRDKFGVPYVYGVTDNDTAYGAGYAGTEDRMFVMDALRYAGSGRYSELLGATKDNLAQDADLLRQADYTPAEANAQLDALSQSGAAGKELVSRLDSFVAGVNAARQALCPTVTAPSCPTPYRLLHLTPTPYTRADIVYAGALIGGIYGRGGGQEAQNALFLRQLQAKLGDTLGRQVLTDLQDPLDPSAVVTVPGEQPYGQPGPIDQAAVALPDLPGGNVKVAAGTGGIPSSATPPSGSGAGGGTSFLDSLQLPAHMSNAMLVSGSHTTTGKPIAVMGPQTGYQAPNFFDEIALHGPNYDARGVAFANLQFAVLIGHGRSYAWSATSSSGDVIDTVLDKLCNTDGSKATINSTAYLNGTNCEPMTGTPHQIHDSTGKVVATLPDMRTRHGIVQYRTTADGTPVAVVSERSTYNHEVDSVLGFAEMNDPNAIHGPKDFIDAFSKMIFTFNWFYVDTRDIATFTSGALPLRAKGVDPDLPRWGDAKWDWTGFLPTDQHPQVIDPPSGYIVNWNNKPSVGTYSADDEWGWGPVQRVLALRDRMQASIKAGKLSPATLDADMIDAATVDIRGAYLLKDMLAMVGDDPTLKQYTALLQSWLDSGAHRVDRARTGQYSDQAAIALMDTWYPLVAKQILQPRLGSLTGSIPTSLDDLPNGHGGSSFDNVASYQWVKKDLESVLGQHVDGALSQQYCGKGDLATCRSDIQATLQKAVDTLGSQQHTTDATKWTYEKTQDDIHFQYVGETVAPIDWQNRPTFQQVVG
jgi:acyl-homoserine lactone acylase PvdQ